MSSWTIKAGSNDHIKLETAISHLIDVALPRADNIDEGYFFEVQMVRDGSSLGTYKVTIERTQKP